MSGFDRAAIAARIRDLLAGQDDGDPAIAARRLGVDEVGLRMSIDDLAPNPTVDVVAAIVLAYGVDPTWLLTGNYDSAVHRFALEDPRAVGEAVARMMFAADAAPALRLVRPS
jgi:hypothetical protein